MMNVNKEELDALRSSLTYKRKNVYSCVTEEEIEKINEYAKGYCDYLDNAKTEREAVKTSVAIAEANGFVPYNFGDKLEVGGKYYYNTRGKSLYLFRIGSENVEHGIRISAAHIDSPRLDLKPSPVYEEGNMCFFKTHYYGGIKKYQWTAMPLALHGCIITSEGKSIDVCIGEDDNDPIFYINDLLPHLGRDQMAKPASQVIPGEKLNILVGSIPLGEDSNDIKLGILKILNEKYGIKEDDFLSAEISAVPAFKAREIGFDRSIIGAYGHDDRVCAYPALSAIIETEAPVHTIMAILADKEEIGSGGNTGMRSDIFTDLISEISIAMGANERLVKANSKCLSADVNAAYDPNFAEVYESRNSAFVNCGVVMSKYTGSGGKGGTSDASAEMVAFVRNIFDKEGVIWQSAELGKVDQGGGGTVAVYIASHNIDVVDLGVGVISMHAPYEAISKADLYMTYKAFLAFNK